MKEEDAIKYLQQLYPNGGHCWLDEQRIEAIGMAIQALQEEPVSEQNLSNVERIGKDWKEEPVSEDFKKFEEQYLEKEKDEIISVYDRHAGLVDGAQWQKKQIMKELSIGEYRIPKGLVARISDGVLTVRESRQRLEVTEHRCRDCKHFGCGHATDSNWTTTVCFEKPKELKHKRIADKIYYHVGSMHKICSLFDLREGE